MVLMLCNFRVNEYMEITMTSLSTHDLEGARSALWVHCEESNADTQPPPPPHSAVALTATYPPTIQNSSSHTKSQSASALDSTSPSLPATDRNTLSSYIYATLTLLRIARASAREQSGLRTALYTFLTSHLDQPLTNAFSHPKTPIPIALQHHSSTPCTPSPTGCIKPPLPPSLPLSLSPSSPASYRASPPRPRVI